MKITAIALARPVAVAVLTLAVAVTGLFGLTQLDVDYLPEITYPMIKIHIWWQGATPGDVETNIAEPLERVLATVDGLDYLESSSIEGMYTLLVNFQYGVDVEEAYQDVTAAMGRVTRDLPPDMDPPVIIKADPSQLPVMQVVIHSDERDLVWLREWADNWLSERLTAVPGTAGVEVVGGLEREIRVHLDPQRLAALGLAPAQIAQILSDENQEMFAGRVTLETREVIARTLGEFESLEEIENLVIAHSQSGEPVYLRDIATVEDYHEDMRVNTRFNGRPCVMLNVLKQADANTVRVAEAVRSRLAELRGEIPEDIEFGFTEDQGQYVRAAISSVQSSALLAAVLVIAVVYLFMGGWRQVVVMAIALPVTLAATFAAMHIFGFSLNLFSMGGLVVALGVILDNSIVVLENISRLRSEGQDDASLRGTSEVGTAIIAATLTFSALFLPFLLVSGLAVLLFRELVLVVASVVGISLLVAVTLTPLLAARLLPDREAQHLSIVARLFSLMLSGLTRAYGRLLAVCVRHSWSVVIAAGLLFIGGLCLAAAIGSEFLPKVDDGRLMIKVRMPSGTAVETVDALLGQIEEQIRDLPEIESVFSLAGGKVWGLYTYEIANEGELDIQLVPRAHRDVSTQEFIQRLTPLVRSLSAPGALIAVMQMKVKGIRSTGEQEIEVQIEGADLTEIYRFAGSVADRLRQVEGLRNINISMDMTKPEFQVHVDRARASSMGIPLRQVATTLRGLVQGSVATQYREESEYFDIRVMIPEPQLSSRTDFEGLVVGTHQGQPVYLSDIAEVRRAVGPVEIVRENQIRQVLVRADSDGISIGDAAARAERALSEMNRPPGLQWRIGGQLEMMEENRRTMSLVFGFAALFAFVVLAIQFESLKMPFLIMVSIPLALTGSFTALFVTGAALGVTVMIGLVVMMGAITSQGVVLLSLAEQRRQTGVSAIDAILRAAPIRVRPILMTQMTTVLGLLPLALNLGEGGDMLQPMAIAVIGGLIYSLFLTLLFLPALYVLLHRARSNRGAESR